MTPLSKPVTRATTRGLIMKYTIHERDGRKRTIIAKDAFRAAEIVGAKVTQSCPGWAYLHFPMPPERFVEMTWNHPDSP